MEVNSIIRDAVYSIPDTYYLRATDQEANIEMDDIDLIDITVCIYNNLPTINNVVSNGVVAEYPVEIKILQLADYDDNDVDGDVIREACMDIAYELQYTITSDNRTSQAADVDNFIVDMLDQVKLYDKILTGVELRFNLPIPKNNC